MTTTRTITTPLTMVIIIVSVTTAVISRIAHTGVYIALFYPCIDGLGEGSSSDAIMKATNKKTGLG